MRVNHTRHFDATLRARRAASARPVARVESVPTGYPVLEPRPASLSFAAWLQLRGLAEQFRAASLAGDRATRQELCRRFECERRGSVYQTAAERAAELPILTTATVA